MLKLANFTLVLVTLGTASVLYNLEHTTRGQERTIAKAKAEMVDSAEAIKLLKAEWSSLTRPDRLQRLAEEQLKLQPVKATQIISVADVAAKIPDTPVIKLDDKNADPIGAILEKMQ